MSRTYYLVARSDLRNTLRFYGEFDKSPEWIIANRAAKNAHLKDCYVEGGRVLRKLLDGGSASTEHVKIVGYFLQSGFIVRPDGWSKSVNAPLV